MKLRQLFIDDLPPLCVQLAALGRIGSALGLFNQLVVALIDPAVIALRIAALRVDIAIEKGVRIRAIAMALHQGMEVFFFQFFPASWAIDGIDAHLETDLRPHAL